MSCIDAMFYAEGVYQHPPHSHNTYQILFVRSGSATLRVGATSYVIDRPSVVFISYLENHTFLHVDKHYCRYVVNLRPDQARAQLQEGDRLLSPFTNRPAGFSHVLLVEPIAGRLETLFSMLNEEWSAGDFPQGEAAILQTILQCLYRFAPEVFPYSEQAFTSTVQQIKQRFELEPAQQTPLSDLAEEYHVSVSYLAHSFKQVTGYSVGQYRLLCRLAAAKTLLLTTGRSITDIGAACGFSDMSNFSRYFRREIGCSPSEFRRNRSSY